MSKSPALTRPIIDVRDAFCLHRVPYGAVAALRGLSLTVERGEKLVVHGPNGSGKTTLLRVLIGDHELASGEVNVCGRTVGDSRRNEVSAWRAGVIGWVDQFPARTLRPEFGVLDNVALQLRIAGMSMRDARARASAALERIGADDLATRTVASLSGGEAQRVAVAAALAHEPPVVLADEPAGQLDAEAADIVYRALADGVRDVGSALVLVSHDRRAASIADRVLHIRDGRASEVSWPERDVPAPSGSGELLVLDDRGWVRLPEHVRAELGGPSAVSVAVDGGAVVLRAEGAHQPGDAMWMRPAPSVLPAEPAAAAPDAQRLADDRDGVELVTLTAVAKRFDGHLLFDGVSLGVAAGTVQVIAGRSGSGKSTVLRVLAGLERPDAGTVSVCGVDLATLDRSALAQHRRQHVGMLLQEVHLAETESVADNLDVARAVRGLAESRETDAEWLDRLGVAHLVGRQARMCSGGERQRIAIARALVGAPPVVVLDEPTSQLDEATAERLVAALRDYARAGRAVIVATHDPLVIAAADAVLDVAELTTRSAASATGVAEVTT